MTSTFLRSAPLALAVFACRPPTQTAPVSAPEAPLHLDPVADLAPAGGLVWLVDTRPRSLLSDPQLIAAIAALVSEAGLDAFARDKGVDLRTMDQLTVAHYGATRLFLAHEVTVPAKLEWAFTAHVADVSGRTVDRSSRDPREVVIRVSAASGLEHQTLVLFGMEAAGLALGDDGPLRASELFATGRLRRALPAWRAPPLDTIANLLGEAPLRAAAPGPFSGEWRRGLGGVLAAATGAGAAVRFDEGALRIRIVVTGTWAERATDAEARLREAYDVLAASGLGHLLGLHRPVTPPSFRATTDVLGMDVSVDALAFLRGLAAATTTQIHDILYPIAAPMPPPTKVPFP